MSDFEKLINARDLFDWIMETYPDWCVGAIRGIVDHIKKMPSAEQERTAMEKVNLTVPIILNWKDIEGYLAQHDIVEVVRCKDCEFWPYRKTYWYSKKIEHKSYPWCFHMDRGTGAGHCSKGERMKTDENQVL